MKSIAILVLSSLLFADTASVLASDCVDYSGLMRVVARTPVHGQLLCLQGHEALVVDGNKLHRFDLSNPEAPLEEGVYELPVAPDDLVWKDDTILFSTQGTEAGIYAFRLDSPPLLQPRGFVAAVSDYSAIGLGALASGSFVAVAIDSLHVLELPQGGDLQRRTSIKLPVWMTLWSIDGDRICMGQHNIGSCYLADLSHPDQPQVETTLSGWRGASAVLKGDWIYLTDRDYLHVLYVADLMHPQETGRLAIGDMRSYFTFPKLKWGDATLFFIAEGTNTSYPGTLLALDVSDPFHPKRVGSTGLQCLVSASVIEQSRSFGFVLSNDSGVLETVDLNQVENIKYALTYPGPPSYNKVRSMDGGLRAILSSQDSGIQVLEPDPNGTWISTSSISTYPSSVANFVCDGRYVYAGTYYIPDPCCGTTPEFFVYDLQEQRNLGDLGVQYGFGLPNHLVRDGSQVVVSCMGLGYDKWAYCIDHSPGQDPQRVGYFSFSANVFPVKGAWYSLSGAQLRILGPDETNTYYLGIANTVELPHSGASWLIRAGDYLYALGNGIVVLDVSDPQLPVVINSVEVPYAAGTDAAIEGNLLVVPREAIGLSFYDLSDPTTPRWIGIAPAYHKAMGVAIGLNDILVTDPSAGLLQYPLPCQLTAVAAPPSSAAPILPSLMLQGAVPNPFNPATEIVYYQAVPSEVALKIYDTRGRLVWTHEGFASEGWHRVRWNGTDVHGNAVASGSYRVLLEAQHERRTKAIMLVR